jgi:hypothetical protein
MSREWSRHHTVQAWASTLRATCRTPHISCAALTCIANTCRDTEAAKSGKEWKFAVVDAAARNAAVGALGDAFAGQLRRFHEQGPYYVKPAPASVATKSH